MRLPAHILVGPAVFTVSTDEVDLLRAANEMHFDLLGHCDPRRSRITINPEQSSHRMRATLLHECLHAVFEQLGLAGDDEEATVARLAPALLDLLRRNPDLVTFLTE